MATVSRFGSKKRGSSSHRSIENILADVPLSEAVKSQVVQLVADLCAQELGKVDKKINELVGKELGVLDKKIDDYIKSKNVLVAKPNVVDFGNRRLTHVKNPYDPADAVTLQSLPYTTTERPWAVHFGSHRLLTTGTPSSAQDLVTVAYADSHYEPKKKIGRGAP